MCRVPHSFSMRICRVLVCVSGRVHEGVHMMLVSICREFLCIEDRVLAGLCKVRAPIYLRRLLILVRVFEVSRMHSMLICRIQLCVSRRECVV